MMSSFTSRSETNVLFNSVLLAKAAATGKIVFTDFDDTLITSDSELRVEDYFAAMKTAEYLETRAAVVVNTARVIEILLRPDEYIASIKKGGVHRLRPNPIYDKREGRYIHHQVEVANRLYRGFPDSAACFGLGIFHRHPVGHGRPDYFMEDIDFKNAVGGRKALAWRKLWIQFIKDIGEEKSLSLLDNDEAFSDGLVDVEALPYRIQLEFLDPERGDKDQRSGLEKRAHFKRKFRDHCSCVDFPYRKSILVDESNPTVGRYVSYLMPKGATKERMNDWILKGIADALGRPTSSFKTYIIGDACTDWRAACMAGMNSDVTVFMPPKSRIVPSIINKTGMFAGEPLYACREKRKSWRGYCQSPDAVGYEYQPPSFSYYPVSKRMIYFGDNLYPNVSPGRGVRQFILDFV